MPQLEVVTDNAGRISHYYWPTFRDNPIAPGGVADFMTGDERVCLKGVEYNLTENGSLIHPDVEVIDSVQLGSGVLVGEGTNFHRTIDGRKSERDVITIGNHAKLRGSEIHNGAAIGPYAVVLAQFVGGAAKIGEYARLGTGTKIKDNVQIEGSVKVDRESLIEPFAVIGFATRLGYRVLVGRGAIIGADSQIGLFTGAGPRGVNQDGPVVMPGAIVPPKTISL